MDPADDMKELVASTGLAAVATLAAYLWSNTPGDPWRIRELCVTFLIALLLCSLAVTIWPRRRRGMRG